MVQLLPIVYYLLNFESFLMSWYCCKYEFEQCKIYTLPECLTNDIAKCRIVDLENIEKEYSLIICFSMLNNQSLIGSLFCSGNTVSTIYDRMLRFAYQKSKILILEKKTEIISLFVIWPLPESKNWFPNHDLNKLESPNFLCVVT